MTRSCSSSADRAPQSEEPATNPYEIAFIICIQAIMAAGAWGSIIWLIRRAFF